MTNLKNHNLGFFLTEGVPLKTWELTGILSREIEPYNILAQYFNKIYIFTHGDKNELKYQKYLNSNIQIIYNNTNFKGSLYSFLLPFIHRKIIKQCTFLKTNQMLGSQALIMSKLFINRKSNIIIRTGHQLSFVKKRKKERIKYLKALLLEFFAYKICQIGLVTSSQMKKSIIKSYNISKNKIIVIANYINTDIFKPEEKEKFKDRIVFIGRSIPQKNLPNLIKALKNTNIILDLYGYRTNTKRLEDLATSLKVKVNFLDKNIVNNKIPTILNKYKIFILPSKWEGMPKTLLEAMSCGLACIGTDVAGTKELITNNENGLLAETNPASLREKMLKLMNDEELQRKLGTKARQFVVDNYSLHKEIKKEIKIYEKLI